MEKIKPDMTFKEKSQNPIDYANFKKSLPGNLEKQLKGATGV